MDLADLPGRPCPVAAALELVGDRWSLLVVREVDLGSHRFTEIQRARARRGTGSRPGSRPWWTAASCAASSTATRRNASATTSRTPGTQLVPVLRSLYAWGERWACTPGPGVASTPRSARA